MKSQSKAKAIARVQNIRRRLKARFIWLGTDNSIDYRDECVRLAEFYADLEKEIADIKAAPIFQKRQEVAEWVWNLEDKSPSDEELEAAYRLLFNEEPKSSDGTYDEAFFEICKEVL